MAKTLAAGDNVTIALNPDTGNVDVTAVGEAGSIDFLQAGTGAVARSLQSKGRDFVSLKDFGAVGDGVTDDSAAWAAAIAYLNAQAAVAILSGKPLATGYLLIPAGDYNIATGATVANCNLVILGSGRTNTRLRIGAGQYLLTSTSTVYRLELYGVVTSGGAGIWRHTNAAINVQGQIVFEECDCEDYTAMAFGSLAQDMPLLKFSRLRLCGATGLTSKGIVLVGDNAGTIIDQCDFERNLYHVQLGRGGLSVTIRQSSFIRWTNGGGAPELTDIWIVGSDPNVYYNDNGLTAIGNKHGNENRHDNDFYVLVADMGAGTNAFDKPHSTAVSTALVPAATFRDNDVSGAGTPTKGFIYSYTPNLRSSLVDDVHRGSPLPYVFHYDAALPADRTNATHLIRIRSPLTFEQRPPQPSNWPGFGVLDDPFNLHAGRPYHTNHRGAGFDAGWKDLTTASLAVNSMTLVGVTRAAGTDLTGGGNAAELTFSAANTGVYAYGAMATTTAGRHLVIDVDIQEAATRKMPSLIMKVLDSGGAVAHQQIVTVPAFGQTQNFEFDPRANEAYNVVFYADPATFVAGVADKVKIGRVRVYHATGPINFGAAYLEASATYDPPSLADGAGASTTVTCVGAALGDFAEASFASDLGGITVTAWVSALDTVGVRFQNETGGTLDLPSATLRVRVRKKND